MQIEIDRPAVVDHETQKGSAYNSLQVTGMIALALVVGLLLRIVAARDSLWLDELWSMLLVRNLDQPFAVFYAVSHDNNHFLNAFWLALIGPDHSPLVIRGLSVLFGALTVAAAARLGFRRGPYVAIVTALLFAIAYPMVHYGSEARGYAGLILATVVAIDAFERALVHPEGPDRVLLGIAIGFGTLSHLTMIVPAAILGMVALVHFGRLRGPLGAIDPSLALFRPAMIAILPTAIAMAAGIFLTGHFEIGGTDPFSVSGFVAGFGGLSALTLGLPISDWSSLSAIGIVGVIGTLSAVMDRESPSSRRLLTGLSLVIIPLVVFAAHLNNTVYPRYFLFAGVVLLIVVGDLIGRALAHGGAIRAVGAGILALLILGHGANLARFFETGRGNYDAIVARMAEAGPAVYISNEKFKNGTMVDHYAMKRGVQMNQTNNVCDDAVGWYVYGDFDHSPLPNELVVDGNGCSHRFAMDVQSDYFGLSGWRWTLYRKVS